ncbi:MAG: hypothetical protein AB1Z23_13020 [Eubacteriales bacterium]
MSNTKEQKIIAILRWTTRILGLLIVLLFAVFFIGEADFSEPIHLTIAEIFLILCIPVTLIIGIIIAWKKEILGGIIIVFSILAFNIVSMISEGFTFELEMGLFLFIGLLYIICGVADRRLQK